MKFQETGIEGLTVVSLKPFRDERGYFERIYCGRNMTEAGFEISIVQINHSFNRLKGTMRGLHYQYGPHKEVKIVRCVAGRVLDYCVDLRKYSPTFLKVFAIELTEELHNALIIPKGFAHGFLTLDDDSHLLYLHSEYYTAGYESGLNFRDPRLNIKLPFTPTVQSARDNDFPFINDEFQGII